MNKDPFPIYSLRLELEQIQPLIWRRVWVPATIVLERLHKVIQASMGWNNTHLHSFGFDDTWYQLPDPHFGGLASQPPKDERGQRLDRVLERHAVREFSYEYDFGDGWRHRVVVESIAQSNPFWRYPVCVAGERACPPEDVGGPPGYEYLLENISVAEPADDHDAEAIEDWRQSVDWIGGFFDAEGFDPNAANHRLAKLRTSQFTPKR